MVTKKSFVKRFMAVILTVFCVFSFSSCALVEACIGKLVEKASNRSYIIRFNANGGEGEMEDFFVEAGAEGLIPRCEFTKEGYECLAWSKNPEGTEICAYIQTMTFWLPLNFKEGSTVNLYAVWTTPGFTFEVSGFAWEYYATVATYNGTAKDVIVPIETRDYYNEGFGGSYGVRSVQSGVFAGHTEIESVKNLPISYGGGIAKELFSGCTSLKTISTHSGRKVAFVGNRAFYNCALFEGIDFATNEEITIGEEAFYGCTSIKKLVIPKGIESIGKDAFYGWTEEQTIEFLGHSENVFGEEWLNGCSAKIIWRSLENEKD